MESKRNAFTLIELLIVVSILGLMAMIVVPHYVGASDSARSASLSDQMRIIREQFNVYRAQHLGRWPGTESSGAISTEPDCTVFQLTGYTDSKGNMGFNKTSTLCLGAYLPSMPTNPISGRNTLMIVTGSATPTPDDTTGWIYQPETGRIWPNQTGNDSDGKAYFSY